MTLRADKGTWEERARQIMRELIAAELMAYFHPQANGLVQRMKALLAEPAEPAYKPGDEIPGYVAAEYASKGRAAEVEWRWDSIGDEAPWLCLAEHEPPHSWMFMQNHGVSFRLRPAPTPELCEWCHGKKVLCPVDCHHPVGVRTCFECSREVIACTNCQPEPTPREAFEEAMEQIKDLHRVHRALRALADEVFKP